MASYSGEQQVKTVITTDDIKEIVGILNNTFNENFSLVSFDEQKLIIIMLYITDLNSWNYQIRLSLILILNGLQMQKQTIKIQQSTKLLNFQQFDEKWSQSVLQADKKVIYPIFYYLLTRLSDLEKRAYLAKYLVPIWIMTLRLVDQIKDLQAQFQVHHQSLEQVQSQSMNPEDLKIDITQFEQEREQLLNKISSFISKVSQFQ